MAATMKWGLVEGVHLVVHNELLPSDEEWNSYVEDLAREFDHFSNLLVYSDGGSPNSRQRRTVAGLYQARGRTPRIAVVTESPVARAAVTAINWIFRQPIKPFSPAELRTAMKYLGLEGTVALAVERRLRQWARDLNVEVQEPA